MEQSTKTILWILAFITLPITIPLAIISFGALITVLLIILGIFLMDIKATGMAILMVIMCYGIYKWLSRNG
ncbi:hypothetical protein KAR91_80550 [Candidatus Pacearchaeota archaeon]|nr:hypothetical protein [Candidatus Pacearchaeota archaeon]